MNEDAQNGDIEYHLPCAEALLAGTLALMTAHTQACCANHRSRMEAKILSNLSQLGNQAGLSPQFRAALANVRRHWQVLHGACADAATAQDARLWHASSASFQ